MSGLCGVCGSTDLSVGGDGFSYCNVCGSQSQFFQDQAFDYDDTHVYNARNVRERAVARKESTQLSQQLLQTQASQLLQSQASQLQATPDDLAYFSQFVENPTPYFSQAVTEVEKEEELPDRVRRVYVEGVQILVQMQCEALVERFGATPLVCGVLGPVWLKFVRSTGVFEKGWAEEALLVAEAQHERGDGEDDDVDEEEELFAGPDDKPLVQSLLKPRRKKRVSGEPWTTYGERTRFVYLRSLKSRIPLRASLAITFLVCHLAREPILPTDIINWAYEGTLPYLSAYTEIEKRFNHQSISHQLFKASKIFKPQRMTNARVVEYLASLIGDRIGLQLPPVNFHLISRRFLRELGLPVDALAPHVCRVFEWFPSSGVWLTSQVSKLPTRVCVMAVLVVVFKVLYKLDGRAGEDEEQEAFLKKMKALLEDDADQVDDQEQLTEYLRYCRETIFANDGMSNDEDLRDHFWELYEQSVKQGALRGTISRESEEVESETGLQLENTHRHKEAKKNKSRKPASKLRTDPLLRGMEDLGFFLLDPPKQPPREDEYWTYIITRDDMRPVHEQYLLVLRACAKIIDVDPRAMHLAVLNVEKGIIDAEKKVLKFLAMQHGRSLEEASEQMEEVD